MHGSQGCSQARLGLQDVSYMSTVKVTGQDTSRNISLGSLSHGLWVMGMSKQEFAVCTFKKLVSQEKGHSR